ncbi:lytic polysaccharide monooxygenase [Xylariaceae sp. FL1651]|nr:lytic polysaccharide monooxygenase [Xylariaceae sp. FL1651]
MQKQSSWHVLISVRNRSTVLAATALTMPSTLSIAAFALPFLQLASAHGYVAGVKVNQGAWIAGCNPNWYYYPSGAPKTPGWQALNQDNGFVAPDAYQTTDIACHKSATPGQTYISANPGDVLTVYWNTWPDTHKGPIINYLAKCNGECTSATPGGLSFTKISQGAYLSGSDPGTWVTDTLIAQNFTSDVTIPAGLAAGNYVLRHEIIALHSAANKDGAQSYPQCLNIKVGGSGTKALPAGEAATKFYTETDPGILFNLYTSFSSYSIPGPALWTG